MRFLDFALALTLLFAGVALPQERRARTNDDIFRKVGITKLAEPVAAPNFTLRDASGGNVALGDVRGSVVLLNFWATWCGPCRDEMPSMERLHREFSGRGLVVLAVNQKESSQQVAGFMRSRGLSFAAPLDLDGRVSARYRVWGIPKSYLIDPSGRMLGMKYGSKDWSSPETLAFFNVLIGQSRHPTAVAGLNFRPPEPLAGLVRVTSVESAVHAQQDTHSEIVAKLLRGEELVPIAKASGAGEVWYMISTKAKLIGWIKAVDVEEIKKDK